MTVHLGLNYAAKCGVESSIWMVFFFYEALLKLGDGKAGTCILSSDIIVLSNEFIFEFKTDVFCLLIELLAVKLFKMVYESLVTLDLSLFPPIVARISLI